MLAGTFAGLAGALFAFSKGSISPVVVSIVASIDALVMVLLGGVQTLTGPVVGAAVFTWLQDVIARDTDYWRAVLGVDDPADRARSSRRASSAALKALCRALERTGMSAVLQVERAAQGLRRRAGGRATSPSRSPPASCWR